MLTEPLYIVACVVVPLVWGLTAYGVTRLIERRWPRRAAADKPEMPELEYYL
jgi:hypothetical protein